MSIKFNVNGFPYEVQPADYAPDITLNTFLREHLHLTATKYMCLEGGCGSCVCVIQRRHPISGEIKTHAVNSCLMLLNTCNDVDITTDEGLGNKSSGYHPIQKRLARLNGSQCGYCSPGFVMNMYGLLEGNGGQVTMSEVEDSFGGNICRCTGYRPILDAMKSFASDSNIEVPADCVDIEDSFELLCPRTGQCSSGSCSRYKMLQVQDNCHWYWPKTLSELFEALGHVQTGEEYILVGGNTAHGVYRRSRSIQHFIDVNLIPELKQHSIESDHIFLGANISLTDAMQIFQQASSRSGFEYCAQLWKHFNLIANVPVRNNGTLAGNISIKKQHPEFPSDVFITFETLDVHVLVHENASTQKAMSLLDYLQDTTPKLVIGGFFLRSYPKDKYLFNSYKILSRAQNVHAYVNAGFLIEWYDIQHSIVASARLCFGNIRPDFVHAQNAEQSLVGRNLYDSVTVAQVFGELRTSLQAVEMPPEASPEYREILACSLFYKFLLGSAPKEVVQDRLRSGGQLLERPLSSGKQTFETIPKNYPITQAVQKLEGLIQCSGEAKYMNDLLTTSNAVHCAFVTAKRVGATIELIDATAALQCKGVLAFYTLKDIPGDNNFYNSTLLAVEPEEIFCAGLVKHYDQPLGVIAATTHDVAVYAATLVQVTYANSQVKIYTRMNDVLADKAVDRIFTMTKKIEDIPKIMPEAGDVIGRGILELESQYHFTIEPQTTIVVPVEEGLQVWCATQWMDVTQASISRMLKLDVNAVQLQVRRIGGAYGAKVTRGNQVACACALVAFKLNRPARFVQTIEAMMECNGKRWACRSDYDFQVRANGSIRLLTNNYYEDAGCTLNENVVDFLTRPALPNVYNLTSLNYKARGIAIRTDATSSTWCRAPGTAEAIAMTETALENIAFACKLDPADARLVNLRPGNKMVKLLPRFLISTEYRKRRIEINLFNSRNRWRKRGLGLSVMEFPVNVSIALCYPATVAIYHADGSVVISHGGIEMGQGLNTKVAQVAAFILGVPLDRVRVETTNTVTGANAFVTANSMASEIVGVAVRKSCNTLNQRLEPVKRKLGPRARWEQVVEAAFNQSISLIATESFNMGDQANYSVFGLSLSELEVDILTGNHLIRRVDILEDAGESLSPSVDVGQVEGAFVMGLGYYLTELLLYDRETGRLLTNRTWNYHPPGAKDIPIDFRIELLQKSPNPVGFLRSKATGEPAFCLAVSVLFAMQHAIQSAREDAGLPREWVRLGAPTTPETVVLSSGSEVNQFALQ